MQLWADFNNIHHGNRTSVSLAFASSPRKPEIGEEVELYDGVKEGEGNRCLATVINVRDSIVDLELDWETWIPEDDEILRVARVLYLFGTDGLWRAESPDFPGYTAIATNLDELRELVSERLPEFAGEKLQVEEVGSGSAVIGISGAGFGFAHVPLQPLEDQPSEDQQSHKRTSQGPVLAER